ncbi:MAG: sugar transferase, partial [Terracoccus sp.]
MRETVLLDIGVRPVNQPLTRRSRSMRAVQFGLAGGDLAIIAAATMLAGAARDLIPLFETGDAGAVAYTVGGYILVLWMVVLGINGAYARSHLGVGTSEYAKVIFA